MTNEELVEEIMWIAFENDVATELIEKAGDYMSKDKLDRVAAYEKAFHELELNYSEEQSIYNKRQ